MHMPYVSGGVPASIMESEEEPLLIAGESIFAVRVARMPISYFDLGEEPLLIGGRSLFVEA